MSSLPTAERKEVPAVVSQFSKQRLKMLQLFQEFQNLPQ